METDVAKKYKELLVKSLMAFDTICREYNLNYYACGGTAIGALRHKGIIPWDDDIDLFMPRADYEKLILLKERILECGYNVQSLKDDGYIYPFVKFCDINTTLLEFDNYDCVLGVYIDIFPMDSVGNNVNEIINITYMYDMLFYAYQTCLRKKGLFVSFLYELKKNHFSQSFEYLKILIGRALDPQLTQKRIIRFESFEKELTKQSGDNYYVYHNSFGPEKEIMNKAWYDSYTYKPFEDITIRVQCGVHEYLTQVFGNYMKPPPIAKQVTHHSHYYLNLKEGLSLKEVKNRIKNGEKLVY